MATINSRLEDSQSDPLAIFHLPPPGETAVQKAERVSQEMEAKHISQQIDRALEAEAKERRRVAGNVKRLDVLLLGPTEAGKSTFLRQLRLQYDVKGLDAERECLRLVILLSLVTSVKTLLDVLDRQDANDDTPLFDARTTQPPLREPKTPRELAARRRLRLAPFLALEHQLREALDLANTGTGAESIAAHAAAPLSAQLHNDYQDKSLVDEVALTLNIEHRGAQNSPPPSDPIVPPGRLAQLVSTVGFGTSKDSRRAKAQSATQSPNWTSDGKFFANKDDPIHLVAALKNSIVKLWKEAQARGLVVGVTTPGDPSAAPQPVVDGAIELNESSVFFLNEIDRIATPEWLPGDQDLLNVRIRTRGIEAHDLQLSSKRVYRICDVAGARGSKFAWAPFFQDASAIIFICAVSEYNVCDPTDPTRNRLRDALLLFKDICENRLLRSADIITFMNKVDVLRRKVKSGQYPIQRYFPRYLGSDRTSHILSFFQTLFEECHRVRRRPFYIFATQANDARSIVAVTAAVNDILIRSEMTSTGIL
ncbi:BZ3500_MvSof-1268-A1-R1_Chr1-3g02097 [Microbotryum saponariae]|uniref:BZ3500_MvSof-1268-A1-R1_Chr1-3g02097 protein n=1 Tax=Microbotryum saponariae TaxID=289078 RepID=A0A2X0KNL7_9BASI|nr:BZ3500_MvSof-1268-A1-R1_Chr1-3g02097 [Microbotryum saponariae]SCZ95399.1 BZ3501_MvSof-1269-A2-R1_Chr1-3g01699 [Microbotryum saponariae]